LMTVLFIKSIYILCAIEHYNIFNQPLITWIVNKHMLTNSESSFFEILSAVAWLASFILFIYALRLSTADSKRSWQRVWIVFYCAVSIFAFGEEISWGDHIFNYSQDWAIVQINAQHETNIHNINIAELLRLSEGSYAHELTKNMGFILTPLFYVLLAFFWCFLPLVKQLDKNNRWRVLVDMPTPSNALIIFFIIHSVIFIATDLILFNVGQIFEMFISLASVIVALDIIQKIFLKRVPAKTECNT
jgi:uncharacterized membrane protein